MLCIFKTVRTIFEEIRNHDIVVELMMWQRNADQTGNKTNIKYLLCRQMFFFVVEKTKSMTWSKRWNGLRNLNAYLLVDIFDFIWLKMITQFDSLIRGWMAKIWCEMRKRAWKKVQLLQLKMSGVWCCFDATL